MSKYPGNQKMNSTGFGQFRATVMSIDSNNMAQCQDQYRRLLPLVSIYNIVGSGALPQVGEDWFISRDNGNYTFKTRIIPKPPVITGSRSTQTAAVLESLLQALQSLGFITDSTTL